MNNPNFTADGILVLRLTHEPDSTGHTLPPSARIRYRRMIPVVFDTEDPSPVGMARLARNGCEVFADLTIAVSNYDKPHALRMLRKLVPAIEGVTHQITGSEITEFEITHIVLSPNLNIDENILPLGRKVTPIPDKTEMH